VLLGKAASLRWFRLFATREAPQLSGRIFIIPHPSSRRLLRGVKGKFSMSDEEPTIIIIGAGTFGASTAYHLSKQYRHPSRITLIDRWDRESPLEDKQAAAAIDTNRIIRTDYASHLYCNLANEARHFWFWSIALQGHFFKTGWTVLDRKGDDFGNAVRRTFKERGGDDCTRSVALEELVETYHDVFKGLKSEDYANAYFNPEAGWCDADKATTCLTKLALDVGVRRVTGEVAELLLDGPQGAACRLKGVRLNDGRVFEADKVLVAAGAWTSLLLSPLEDNLKIPEKDCIERQITAVGRLSAYYTLSEQETQSMVDANMPIVVLGGLADMIPPSLLNRTLKVNDLRTEVVNTTATSSGRQITAPSPLRKQQLGVPKRLVRESNKVVREALPEWTKARTPDRWRICYDAVTPTEDWLMCRHPKSQLDNLYIAVGGSFHSYK
jgi:sarcosine oxidase/L-pipecolate oxidase